MSTQHSNLLICRGWKFQKGNCFFANAGGGSFKRETAFLQKGSKCVKTSTIFSAHDEQHRCLKHLHPLVVSSHLSSQRRDSNRRETCTTFNAINKMTRPLMQGPSGLQCHTSSATAVAGIACLNECQRE